MFDQMPEVNRIAKLLTGMGNGTGSRKSVRLPANAPVSAAAVRGRRASVRTVDGKPFGGRSLGRVLGELNWTNDPDRIPSPLIDENGNVRCLRGALGVGMFLGLINWSNGDETPAWPVRETDGQGGGGGQASVESVLAGFGWDD